MKRTVGARYLPLAAIVAIQLLIVAVAPSTMENQTVDAGGGTFDPGTPGDGSNDFTDPNTGEPVEDTSGADGVTVDTGGTEAAEDEGGGTTPSDSTSPGEDVQQAAQGDKSHCTGDRQFDPAIDFYAPPCVPKSNGQNAGASYQDRRRDQGSTTAPVPPR